MPVCAIVKYLPNSGKLTVKSTNFDHPNKKAYKLDGSITFDENIRKAFVMWLRECGMCWGDNFAEAQLDKFSYVFTPLSPRNVFHHKTSNNQKTETIDFIQA